MKEINANQISRRSDWQSSRKQTTTNAGEDVWKKEPLYTVGGNIN
jgi:hypothetical protein